MNESTEVTLDQVEACLTLFKAVQYVKELTDANVYFYSGDEVLHLLSEAIHKVEAAWGW